MIHINISIFLNLNKLQISNSLLMFQNLLFQFKMYVSSVIWHAVLYEYLDLDWTGWRSLAVSSMSGYWIQLKTLLTMFWLRYLLYISSYFMRTFIKVDYNQILSKWMLRVSEMPLEIITNSFAINTLGIIWKETHFGQGQDLPSSEYFMYLKSEDLNCRT